MSLHQTPDERAALIDRGKDGLIFCIDLDDVEGQAAAQILRDDCPDVATTMRLRNLEDELRYLLVLLPATTGNRSIVMLATVDRLPDAVAAIYERSKSFGQWFAVVVAPNNIEIAALFLSHQESAGTA